MSPTCYRHPETEAPFYCQKDGNHMCSGCARCHSPRIYCQFRTACVIDLLAKEGELPRIAETKNGAGEPSSLQEETQG